MLMTSTGQSIRIRVNEIRETGRVAQGVKLLTLKEGEKLQDISIVIPDGEDSDGALASAGEEDPTTDEPTTDEPTTDEPTTDEPTTDEPTTDEPTE